MVRAVRRRRPIAHGGRMRVRYDSKKAFLLGMGPVRAVYRSELTILSGGREQKRGGTESITLGQIH